MGFDVDFRQVVNTHDLLTTLEGDKDTEGSYLELFRAITEYCMSMPVRMAYVPPSWVALLRVIGASVVSVETFFAEDDFVEVPLLGDLPRHFVAVMCCHRPETSLYLQEMYTSGIKLKNLVKDSTPVTVTCRGDFMSPAIIDSLTDLTNLMDKGSFDGYRNVILIPNVTTDEVGFHSAIRAAVNAGVYRATELLGKQFDGEWNLVEVSGVYGVRPESTWGSTSSYDSAVPNEWRIIQYLRWFFNAVEPEAVISYCTEDNASITEATNTTDAIVKYVVRHNAKNKDLRSFKSLKALEDSVFNSTVAAIQLNEVGEYNA